VCVVCEGSPGWQVPMQPVGGDTNHCCAVGCTGTCTAGVRNGHAICFQSCQARLLPLHPLALPPPLPPHTHTHNTAPIDVFFTTTSTSYTRGVVFPQPRACWTCHPPYGPSP
jgi:hypothetical protein